jgi:hypothetical protein
MANNDGRILLSKEEAQRKAQEKRDQIGITFERMTDGMIETRVASTVEHIAAFFNSSDEGPNAKNKQDFGWRLAPEDLIELEDIKNDPTLMERIAAAYQIPAEDVADYNVLKFMASRRFKTATTDTKAETKDYESDYARRVREAREGKTSQPAPALKADKPAADKSRTVNRDAGDGQFVSKDEADKNPGTTVTEKIKPNTEEKVANSDSKPDNKSNS